MLSDLAPGPDSSSPDQFLVAGNRLFFDAHSPLEGRELWMLPLPLPARGETLVPTPVTPTPSDPPTGQHYERRYLPILQR
jgi:hypothetical protein